MTRLNLVPVHELADQHLFAEWREIKMVPRALQRSMAMMRGADYVLRNVPPAYVLGTGHVTFFYNKGTYLRRRYEELTAECLRRGFSISPGHALPDMPKDPAFHLDYTPTPEALALVRARISERLAARPGWYRWSRTVHDATQPRTEPAQLHTHCDRRAQADPSAADARRASTDGEAPKDSK